MGSEVTYENRIINHTVDPLIAPIIFVVSFIILVGSIVFFCLSRKKKNPIPEASTTKKEKKKVVKSDQSIKTKYSDDHLIITSNMKERLKIFDKNIK